MTDSARTYDVVVYGATGFVGRLLAGYLAEHAPPEARIALAGRSRERLQEVRDSLPQAAQAWAVLTADSSDRPALDSLAASTRVLATTVGPYARYGMPVVEACARAGTHYADLTGEVLFVRDAIERVDAVARGTGARIVHACGYDSIPSDLSALLLADRARRDDAGGLRDVRLVATLRGGFSGGTIDSMRAQLEAVQRGSGAAPGGRRPVRAEPRPVRGALHPPAAGRRPAGAHPGRPVDGAVRHGAVQHPDRAAQQRAAGLGVRAGLPLRRGDGLRPRPRRCGDGGRRDRGAGRDAGRHGLPADPRAARPVPAGAGGRPGRRRPGSRAGSA